MEDISGSPVKRNDGLHRYLKPGMRAQIQNSRINDRSTTSLVSWSLPKPLRKSPLMKSRRLPCN
ncbi:unnamed protein product [Arabis nemorensis]|uniref:Uncharacterized protein n=1 Tax=Arabis nemorensis TaxID=586526 RepID=A0A565AWI4_9BRAS|nr:unnamed protein product [Arabis nemorensis]